MLFSTTGRISEHVTLITLGETCRYLVHHPDGHCLIDLGLSHHVPALEERLLQLGCEPESVQEIFATHLDADRIGGISYFQRRNRNQAKLCITALTRAILGAPSFYQQLADTDRELSNLFLTSRSHGVSSDRAVDSIGTGRVIVDSELVKLSGEVSITVISSPFHRSESLAYFILPDQVLLVDEGYGYFRGKELCAPGAEFNLSGSVSFLEELQHREIRLIGFTSGGALGGALVRRHLSALIQNTTDLLHEVSRAKADGVDENTIIASVRDSFYHYTGSDPLVRWNLLQSFRKMCAQLELKVPED